MSPEAVPGRDLDIVVLTGIFPNRIQPTWGIHVFQSVRALSAHAALRVIAPVPHVPFLSGARAPGRYRAFTGVPDLDTIDSYPVHYPRYPVLPRIGRPLNSLSVYLSARGTLAGLVRERRPDALVAYFAYPYGAAAVRLGRRFGLPVVVSCRGSDINTMTGPRAQGALIARSLRAADHVLVVSRDMASRVRGFGVADDRVTTLPNGIDLHRFRPSSRAEARAALGIVRDARVLVCVSRLSPEKGIDVLVDAVAHMPEKPAVYLVGDGLERPALERQARACGIDAQVHFAGTRPHDEVPRWLAAADVVALPSRSEGTPNAVLEALACGRPVVASAVGGVPDVLREPGLGLTVPPGNAHALAGALALALRSSWDEASIARAMAPRSWDSAGAEMARVLRAVVERRAHGASASSPTPRTLRA